MPGFGFRVPSFEFWVLDSGFRAPGSGIQDPGFVCRVAGSGFRLSGFESQVDGLTMMFRVAGLLREQLLRRSVKRFRGGLVFKAHSLLYHSTLGSKVIKKKKLWALGVPCSARAHPASGQSFAPL